MDHRPVRYRAASSVRVAIAATPGVRQVAPPQIAPGGDTALLTVVPSGSPDAASTERLVHRLRTEVLPAVAPGTRVHVGGATATSIDLAERLGARMWWFMLLVVALAFVLLLIEFRSLLVPLVAVVMNLLARNAGGESTRLLLRVVTPARPGSSTTPTISFGRLRAPTVPTPVRGSP
jgi:RND superfamily putative drug exporter